MIARNIDNVELPGPCPFLLCVQTGPHSHSICPECGAVRHGNIGCKTCRVYQESGAVAIEDGREVVA